MRICFILLNDCLFDNNSLVKGINRFGVVLVGCNVIRALNFAHLGGCNVISVIKFAHLGGRLEITFPS